MMNQGRQYWEVLRKLCSYTRLTPLAELWTGTRRRVKEVL
jgi:hypothetical protein